MTEAAIVVQLARIARAEKRVFDLRSKLQDLRSKLQKCSHRDTFEYAWEHDNGYGLQKMMKGLQCRICGKRNSWPGMSQLWS